MGYKRMTVEDLYSIFRRWHAGQSQKHISEVESKDRKTVRLYIRKFVELGYSQDCQLADKNEIMHQLQSLIPQTIRAADITDEISIHREEILNLIYHPVEPVKSKTTWHIVKTKYNLQGSYETFKRFIRNNTDFRRYKQIIMIELPPGLETQIDYGKVGTHLDPVTKRNLVVNAFCGKLSSSRFPFIEFTYMQDGESFISSNINMLEFYEGATEIISLDNLKAGVIKPDLYDPKLNKAYQEMAEYYGIFLDPCRVAKATDKGKVERMVPDARELFRRLKYLHPSANLMELNKLALEWCRNEYGMEDSKSTPGSVFYI